MVDLARVNWNKAQSAPLALYHIVHSNFPETNNLGIYVVRNVAGTKKLSLHATGRALDIGLSAFDPEQKFLGDQLFKLFIKYGSQIGPDHVIWNRKIWSPIKTDPRSYTGKSPHIDHLHVAFTPEGSQRQRTSFCGLALEIATLRSGRDDLQMRNLNYAISRSYRRPWPIGIA
jgi:hypothetical protein